MDQIYEELPVPLTQEEMRSKGGELAATYTDYKRVEEEKKEAQKTLGDQLKEIRERMDKLEREMRTGQELRSVPCYEVKDYASHTVRIMRDDTNELVRTRPMEPGDRQDGFSYRDRAAGGGRN